MSTTNFEAELTDLFPPPGFTFDAEAKPLFGIVDPETLALAKGVRVVQDRLPTGWLGAYHHESRTVTVAPGLDLDPVRYRCVLAHELGHAHYGHTADDYPAGELLADRFAAKLLIRLDEYLEAVATTEDIAAAASVLGVMPWVVRAFQAGLPGPGVRSDNQTPCDH